MALGAMWLQHHLGFQFKTLGWVTFVSLVWGGMSQVAELVDAGSVLGEGIERVFKTPLRALFNRLTRPTPLYFLGSLLVVLMATVSSVNVRSDTGGTQAKVWLESLDRPGHARETTLDAGQYSIRFFPVFTSPFGRLYRIDAEGYVPADLTIYPLLGRQVVLGSDLSPSPSVLFRPFVEGLAALSDGAVLTVSRLRGGKADRLAVRADSGSARAYRLGPSRPVSEATVMLWTLEVTAADVSDRVRAQLLIIWRDPVQLAMKSELAPGDCLLAEIRLHDELKARALVTLTDAPLVDVFLHDVTPDPTTASAVATSC